MASWTSVIIGGAAAGLAAAAAMNLYQRATASLFEQDDSDEEPATVKAADTAKALAGGERVPPPRREAAGNLVHYATGAALGAGYAVLVQRWRPAGAGLGVPFGLATALLLDDGVVPAFGWGAWPWRSSAATNAYGLSAHAVFGAVLEGSRRLTAPLPG